MNPDDRMSAITGRKVLPDASLQVEIGSDRAAIERLHFGGLDFLAETAFTFGLEPEFIQIPAVICLSIPLISIAAFANQILRAIGLEPERGHTSIFMRQSFSAGAHGFCSPDRVSRTRRAGPRSGRQVSVWPRRRHSRVIHSDMVGRLLGRLALLLCHRMPHRTVAVGFLLAGRFGPGLHHGLMIMVLCNGSKRCAQSNRAHSDAEQARCCHAGAPSGATVTIWNIPECM